MKPDSLELMKIARALWKTADGQFRVEKRKDGTGVSCGSYVAWKGPRLTKTTEIARGSTLNEIRDRLAEHVHREATP